MGSNRDVDLANLSVNSGNYEINSKILAVNHYLVALNEDKNRIEYELLTSINELRDIGKEILRLLKKGEED